MATYTHETVSDWTLSWLSAFGGMLGTTLTVFGAMVTIYKCGESSAQTAVLVATREPDTCMQCHTQAK